MSVPIHLNDKVKITETNRALVRHKISQTLHLKGSVQPTARVESTLHPPSALASVRAEMRPRNVIVKPMPTKIFGQTVRNLGPIKVYY